MFSKHRPTLRVQCVGNVLHNIFFTFHISPYIAGVGGFLMKCRTFFIECFLHNCKKIKISGERWNVCRGMFHISLSFLWNTLKCCMKFEGNVVSLQPTFRYLFSEFSKQLQKFSADCLLKIFSNFLQSISL